MSLTIVTIGTVDNSNGEVEIIEQGRGKCYWSQLEDVAFMASITDCEAYVILQDEDMDLFKSTIELDGREVELGESEWIEQGGVIQTNYYDVF